MLPGQTPARHSPIREPLKNRFNITRRIIADSSRDRWNVVISGKPSTWRGVPETNKTREKMAFLFQP
jgi:hypothetical protein